MPEAQLFRLFEFVEQIWEPSISSAKATQMDLQPSLQVVEAFCWLQLGVEIDCYPSREAHELVDQERSFLTELFADNESALERSIPPRLFYALKETLATRKIGTVDSFQNASDLAPYLEAGFALAAKMNASQLISFFRNLLSFQETQSQQFLNDVISDELVAEIFFSDSENYPESAEAAAAGFLKILEELLLWNQLFATLRSDGAMRPGDRAGLARRVGQITYWRLDLNNTSIKRQFDIAAVAFSGFVASVAKEVGLGSALAPPTFSIEIVKQIQQDWQRNHPFHLYLEQSH